MDVLTITAEPREAGKKAARAARKEGNVPCVLYGHHTEPVSFQVPVLELERLVSSGEANRISITVDGNTFDCILKEVDFHPIRDMPIHADFQVLEQGEKIHLTVPVQFHGVPQGQKDGGDTEYIVHELAVYCLPKNIPSHIDVDVAHLKVGDSIHVSDLEIEGVEFDEVPTQTLVTVVAPRSFASDEEEDEELGLGTTAAKPAADAEEGDEEA